jgi:hypothetical protein
VLLGSFLLTRLLIIALGLALKGWFFIRLPVALKIAFATAPPVGGSAGSPNPVGSIPLSTK